MLPKRGLFVTASREGIIKVWNMQKELLREIAFSGAIKSVCFINAKADIAVGHSGQLSVISAKDYKPFERGYPAKEEMHQFIMANKSPVTNKLLLWLAK